MKSILRSGIAFRAALLVGCAIPTLAYAIPATSRYVDGNGVPSDPPPPLRKTVESSVVDLGSGQLSIADTYVTIGDPAQGGLSWTYYAGLAQDNFYGAVNVSGSTYTVSIGASSIRFTTDTALNKFNSPSRTLVYSDQGEGATLDLPAVGSPGPFTLTMRDGSVAVFDQGAASANPTKASLARIVSLTDPFQIRQEYKYGKYTTPSGAAYRLQGVRNNLGYAIVFNYQTSDGTATDGVLINVTGINLTVDYCDTGFNTCTITNPSWPKATLSTTTLTEPGQTAATYQVIKDPRGLQTTYPVPVGIQGAKRTLFRPGGANSTFTFDSSMRVVALTNAALKTWNYSYSTVSSSGDGSATGTATPNLLTTVSDPVVAGESASHTHSVLTSGAAAPLAGVVLQTTDGLNNSTFYSYDKLGRQVWTRTPRFISTTFTYDPETATTPSHGNIIETDIGSQDGSKVIRTYASYVLCPNPVKCNQPDSTKDGNGKQTDYLYSPAGLLTDVKGPPSSGTGSANLRTHQVVKYDSPLFAYYKDVTGTFAQATSPVWRPTSTSVCATAEACLSQAGSTERAISYGVMNTANNLAVTAVLTKAGNSVVTSNSSVTYDTYGNIQTLTNGRGLTTRYAFDAARRILAVIGSDPDGGGTLLNRATAYGYDGSSGNLSYIYQGTAAGQSDSNVTSITPLGQRYLGYDILGRQVVSVLQVGQNQTVAQYGYDDANRPVVSTVRMDPDTFATAAAYASLPAASTPTKSGQFGPDRITQVAYDAADRPIAVTTGAGTVSQRTETTQYTPDSLPEFQTDGNGDKTQFVYDGLDRLQQVNFPTVGAKGTPNGSDHLSYGYDDAGNITLITQRDGSTTTFAYDDAGRLLTRSGTGTPGLTPSNKAPDVVLTYDNLGRVKSAVSASQTLSYVYDALGRVTSQSGQAGTVLSQYDANGNRTRLQWPDGAVANYVYDNTDALSTVTDGASTPTQLASYTYDNLGRRAAVYHAASSTSCQSYAYGGDLNLSSLALKTGSQCANQLQAWGFSWNPGSQLIQQSSSNATFDWMPTMMGVGVDRAYVADALNRYTSSGGVALSYDARGNLTNDTRLGYSYDTLNKLTSVSNGAALTYDAADRLRTLAAASATTRFVYEGDQVIAEYDSSTTPLQRFVPGASTDEYAAWYVAPGQGSTLYRGREYPLTDRQGSVAAVTNDAGSVLGVNTYDDFGQPAGSNMGRFGFDGAPYFSQTDLYHMRARSYSYRLGRFMQADPIGYGDGLNLYNYVHGDPVNGWDPSGLAQVAIYSCTIVGGGIEGEAASFGTSCYISGYYDDGPSVGGTRTGIGGPGRPSPRGPHGVTVARQNVQPPMCDTVLPNGRTIGDVVREAVSNTFAPDPADMSPSDAEGTILSNSLATVAPYGPLDFKNNFRGRGDPTQLAAAGNFSYGAYTASLYGSSVSNFGARLYGTAASLLGAKASRFLAPNGMSKSAAANVPRGNSSGGCP